MCILASAFTNADEPAHESFVFVTADGRAHASSIPTGDIAAIAWSTRKGALAIAKRINTQNGSIETTAAALGIPIASHDTAIARVKAALESVDEALAHAKAQGELSLFNRAFTERRRRARAKGERLPSYDRAYASLRTALFACATRGESLPALCDLIARPSWLKF